MNCINQKTTPFETDKGPVHICSFCAPERISRSTFNPHFGTHAHYKSLYTRVSSLEQIAEQPDANVTLALTEKELIVGFGVLGYPDPGERWAMLEPKIMMEVKAIEVARDWRSTGISKAIVRCLLDHPRIEDKIVYLVGYAWTWDLDGTGKSAQQYRNMLIKLFEPFGFLEYQTNEPNICLKPENVFMGRIGKNVSEKTRQQFKWLCFGISP
jgi:acetoin utilization protein AcuA